MGSRKTQTQRKAKVFVDMKEVEILQALETLAKALDLQVRYEKGDFHGGHCRCRQNNLIVMQKNDPVYRKIHVLARELGTFNLESLYVMPAIREVIQQEQTTAEKSCFLPEQILI
jgi:hypothetical protein